MSSRLDDLHFTHHEVVVLAVFAGALLEMHDAIDVAITRVTIAPDDYFWDDRAAAAARAAVRCARMLTLKGDYR